MKQGIKFIPASLEDWESVRISPCVYTLHLKCLLCDEVVEKEYIGGSDNRPPQVYVCKDCKEDFKQLRKAKQIYYDEGNVPQVIEIPSKKTARFE